jgi:hypothetical protein
VNLPIRFAMCMVATLSIDAGPASAMTIKEFRKFSISEQGMYIGAAVNMLAYSYAANGDTAKASCIKNWYFGKKGVETPGPSQLTIEIDVAENLDAEKYHVEGVILGVTDKACGAGSSRVKQKP